MYKTELVRHTSKTGRETLVKLKGDQNKMIKHRINLQLFAEPPQGDGEGQQQTEPQQQNNTQQQNKEPAFDYDKLASLISGKQSVAEDTVLKNYFKQQGLSKEEIEQAISTFKSEKAKNQPDANLLQEKLTEAQNKANEAALNQAAVLEAVSLGIDAKTIPYILKMADLSNASKEDGTIDNEKIKESINKVLEDVPALKPISKESRGFHYAGSGADNETAKEQQSVISDIFGNTE